VRIVTRNAQAETEIENPFTEQAFLEKLNSLTAKAQSATSS
jgi:hypothetical protein